MGTGGGIDGERVKVGEGIGKDVKEAEKWGWQELVEWTDGVRGR